MIGTRVGRYEILEQLGAGGMGVVYRARDSRLHRLVAIKFLTPQLRADPGSRARFAQEALATSALDHPNICTIFEIDETPEGQTYIVMAHYEGETLEQRLERGPLSTDEAIEVVAQVADGLASAHAAGIVHRDIKPANLFLTREGRVKILDFGIAKVMGATGLTRTGDSPGTPAYMAPEQFEGGKVDERADLWALGALLHATVTGATPFGGDVRALYHAILHREPDPLPATLDRGPALQVIRDRCLRKKPEERYNDAASMARQLRALASTRPVGVVENRRRMPLPARWILAAVVAGLLLAALPGVRNAVFGGAGTLRVAVLAPRVQSEDSLEVALATAAAESAVLSSLAGLRHVSVVDPAELGSATTNAAEAARVTAADEVISVSLAPLGQEWNVRLRRVEGRTGSVKWNDSFAAPREDPWALDAAIRARLPRGFPRNRNPDSKSSQIDREPYEEYLQLLRTQSGSSVGAVPRDQLLPRMELLARRAPRFPDAHLLLGREYLNRFIVDRQPELLTAAVAAAERARALAPWDSRPLMTLADCAFRLQDLPQVERRIASLRALNPGNTDILIQEAKLAERRGEVDRAHQIMLEAFRRRGSRANLRALADLEVRIGRVAEGRTHLGRLLQWLPGDRWTRAKLANLELAYGRPEAADSIYTELIRESPSMTNLTNRGLSRMLMGRFVPASEDFRHALELSPNAWPVLLNLADCEELSGREEEAKAHYRQALESIAGAGRTAGWQENLARAQALAHLGDSSAAVEAAREGVRGAPDNPEALYQASVVHVLVGDRTATLLQGRRAIEKGFESRWFALPWFDGVRAELQARP